MKIHFQLIKALSRNPVDRKWRYYDDNNGPIIVHDIHAFILTNSLQAYVLFYKLERQTSWF
jgi:hypothetical protein